MVNCPHSTAMVYRKVRYIHQPIFKRVVFCYKIVKLQLMFNLIDIKSRLLSKFEAVKKQNKLELYIRTYMYLEFTYLDFTPADLRGQVTFPLHKLHSC